MNTKEVLIAAKTLIEDENNWTKYKLAKNAADRREDYASPNACKFCAIGAVYRSTPGRIESAERLAAWNRLDEAAHDLYKRQVIQVNDEIGHDAVMKVYDLAIAKEQP